MHSRTLCASKFPRLLLVPFFFLILRENSNILFFINIVLLKIIIYNSTPLISKNSVRTSTFTKFAQVNTSYLLLDLRESLCVQVLQRQYYHSQFAPRGLSCVSVTVVTELSLCVTGMEERTNQASWGPGGESSPSYDSSRVRWATRQHL